MQNSTVSVIVIVRLVTGGLTSVILIVLGTINLHFQGPLFPILGFVAAYVLCTVFSSCSELLPSGVLVSIRQLTGYS